GKLPVKDALCPSDQGRSAQRARSRKERLDDVTAGFRIAREPSALEAPSGRDAACVGTTIAHILRAAQPVDGPGEVITVRMLGLPLRHERITRNETHVERPPQT